MIKEIDTKEFEKDVIDSKKVALVDFFATWCGPCKMLSPILTKLAPEFEGKIDFYKVDIDKESQLAQQYRVMSVPTLKIFVDGAPSETIIGLQPENVLKQKLESYVK